MLKNNTRSGLTMLQNLLKFLLFSLFTITFAVNTCAQYDQGVGENNKLDVTILYESLCPDSIRFMAKQLAPSYDKLKQYLNIKLVPFGKSRSANYGSEFYCQHGPDECTGNRLQSCVLHQESSQDQRVRFAICQMVTANKQDVSECTDLVGLSNDVSACADSTLGTQLQLVAEQVTNQYAPKFVPTIVYDGVFNQELQDASLNNFFGTVCGLLQKRAIVNEACH